MSFEVTTAFVQQYKDNVLFLAQQKGSRLREAVTVTTDVVGETTFLEQIGSTSATKVTERHGDSPLVNTPHSRRRTALFDYDWGDLVDNLDKVRMLIDPTSKYAQAAAWAMGRAQDDEVIANIFGTAYTGKDGSTQITFPAAQQVAVNSWSYGVGSGNTGLTISKLIESKVLIWGADVDEDEELHIACSAKELGNLLATTEVTSKDYNSVQALVEGKIDTFLGYKFHRIERLLTDANGYRRCPVWAKSGVGLAIGQDIKARIQERSDKRFSMYVYFCMAIGAARLEEKKVVEIKCYQP